MILYTLSMLALGALLGGYFYRRKFKEEAQKGLEAMYHKGFESGMEKAQADVTATIQAYQDAEVKEEARIAKLAEDIGIEARMEETTCADDCGHDHAVYSISFPKKTKKKPAKKRKSRKSKK